MTLRIQQGIPLPAPLGGISNMTPLTTLTGQETIPAIYVGTVANYNFNLLTLRSWIGSFGVLPVARVVNVSPISMLATDGDILVNVSPPGPATVNLMSAVTATKP